MNNYLRLLSKCMGLLLTALFVLGEEAVADIRPDPAALERSYWVHASLGLFTQRGYFGEEFPATSPPSQSEVGNAARLLCGPYAANRLYLIYHREIPLDTAQEVFLWWRKSCPADIEVVPTILMRMYDKDQTPVFSESEIDELITFFVGNINSNRLAVLDVYENRDQTPLLARVAERYAGGLIRLGLQPGESLAAPFSAAVQDTWSGLCHGRRNLEDWSEPGFGAETLRRWVRARRGQTSPIAWNLVTVAWDYSTTERGGFPGYDDAEKNMPLPSGRNMAALQLIVESAAPETLAGFSSDLYILNENSRSEPHDGKQGALYQTLRQGREYRGYYAAPLQEIIKIFQQMRTGKWP